MPAAPEPLLPAAGAALPAGVAELIPAADTGMPALEPPGLMEGLTAVAPAALATAPGAWPAVIPGAAAFMLAVVGPLPAAEPPDMALSVCDDDPHAAHAITNPVDRYFVNCIAL
jgi:hypothetical protein